MAAKKHLHVLPLYILIIASLMSCDPYGGYEFWIDNKSDSTLYVFSRSMSVQKTEKFVVVGNSSTLIKQYSTINGLHDYGTEFLKSFDSLGIHTDTLNRIAIRKNCLNRDLWSYEQKVTGRIGTLKAGKNIYRFEVTNQDVK